MCCGAGTGMLLIPGTDRAHERATYVKASLLLLMCVAIEGLYPMGLVLPIMNTISVLLGMFAVRHTEGYALQNVFCFLLAQVVMFLYLAIVCINFYADGASSGAVQYSYSLFVAGVFYITAAPIVYAASIVTTYRLHSELRAILQQTFDPLVDGADPYSDADAAAIAGLDPEDLDDDPDADAVNANNNNNNIYADDSRGRYAPPRYDAASSRSSPPSVSRNSSNASPSNASSSPFTGRAHRLD